MDRLPPFPSKYEVIGVEFARWRGSHYSPERYADLFAHVPRPCPLAVDAGCGAGAPTRTLAGLAHRVVGIDSSWTQLLLARKNLAEGRVGNVLLVRGDMCRPPLRVRTVDFVLSILALHHTDRQASLPALGALLAPGGVLAARSWVARFGRLRRLPPARLLVSLRRIFAEIRRFGLRRGLSLSRFLLHPRWLWHNSQPKPHPERFRSECERLLPGCEVHRHDHASVTLVWQRPH